MTASRSLAEDAGAESRNRFRRLTWPYIGWMLLAILLIVFVWLLITFARATWGGNPYSVGTDFSHVYGAAAVVAHHQDPYQPQILGQAILDALRRDGVAGLPRRFNASGDTLVWTGNPPLLFWLTGPLIRFPLWSAVVLWIGALVAAKVVGTVLLLRHVGSYRFIVPTLLILSLPEMALGTYFGNVNGFLYVLFIGGIVLLDRHPLVAGLFFSSAVIKPQVYVPFVLLVVALHAVRWRAVLLGFAASLGGLAALMALATGPASIWHWLRALGGYSRDLGPQVDIASLSGVYMSNVGPGFRVALEVLCLAAVTGVVLVLVRSRGPGSYRLSDVTWVWVALFLAVPFAHIHDAIVLVPALLAFAWQPGRQAGSARLVVVTFLLFLAVLGLAIHPAGMNLQALPFIGVLLLVARAAGPASMAASDLASVPGITLRERSS